jgi:hypothetical protein
MLRKGFTNNHFSFHLACLMLQIVSARRRLCTSHLPIGSQFHSFTELAMERLEASIAKDFQDHNNKNSQRFETLTVKIDQLGDKVGVSFDKAGPCAFK